MKILIIMPGFFPGKKYGGPPVSVKNFCNLMSNYECYIVTRNHDLGDTEPYKGIKSGWNVLSNVNVLYLSDKKFNIITFKNIISKIKPDVLYLQSLFSINSTLPSLILAKIYRLPVILAPRGELCSGAFKKKYKKIPYIILLRLLGLFKKAIIQSTSNDESSASMQFLKVPHERVHLLPNIPSINTDFIKDKDKERGIIKLVFISRIVSKKNLHSALSLLSKVKGEVHFNIYGPIEDSQYWLHCRQIIEELPRNIHVNYCGLVSHDDVGKIFQSHDAFLFPTFSENYGHVIIEAMQNQCIPIISDQTPWTDINEAEAGWAINLNYPDKFVDAINCLVDLEEDGMSEKREKIKAYLEMKIDTVALKDSYSNLLLSACKLTR